MRRPVTSSRTGWRIKRGLRKRWCVQRSAGRRSRRRPDVERRHVATLGQVKTFERGLIWALVRDPAAGFGALAGLESTDLSGLATGPILEQARSLQGWPEEGLPQALVERLSTQEAGLVEEITAQPLRRCWSRLTAWRSAATAAGPGTGGRPAPNGTPPRSTASRAATTGSTQLGMRQLALKQQMDSLDTEQAGAAPRWALKAGPGAAGANEAAFGGHAVVDRRKIR